MARGLMSAYYRPLLQRDGCRPADACALGGGPLWFDHAEQLSHDAPPRRVHIAALPHEILARLTKTRPAICGLGHGGPVIMGIIWP